MNAQEASQGQTGAKWLPFVLLLLALTMYLPTVSKDLVVTDNQAAAASAWRIATTGRPWMEGVPVGDLEGSPYPRMWIVDTPQGHRVHNRTPGVVLAGVPFYWALNNTAAASGFKIWVGGVAASVLSAAAGLFMFYGLRSKVGEGTAFAGTCALLFATPMWSVAADTLWTHSVTTLAIAGAMWAVTRDRWLGAGAFFAVGIFARAHLVVIAAVVGLYMAWRRRDWRIVARVGAGSAVGLLMLAVWNRVVFGSWSLRGGYSDYVLENLTSSANTLLYHVANALGFLMSPDRGLLAWTPVVLLLLPSMLSSWKQLPDWMRAFAFAGVLYSIVQLRINSFQGGEGFYGYRLALELLVCLTPALVYAYKATAAPTRLLVGGLLGLQFAAIAIGSATDIYYVKDRAMWTTNAYILALTDHPLAYGLLSAACAATGVLLTIAVMRLSRLRKPVEL